MGCIHNSHHLATKSRLRKPYSNCYPQSALQGFIKHVWKSKGLIKLKILSRITAKKLPTEKNHTISCMFYSSLHLPILALNLKLFPISNLIHCVVPPGDLEGKKTNMLLNSGPFNHCGINTVIRVNLCFKGLRKEMHELACAQPEERSGAKRSADRLPVSALQSETESV